MLESKQNEARSGNDSEQLSPRVIGYYHPPVTSCVTTGMSRRSFLKVFTRKLPQLPSYSRTKGSMTWLEALFMFAVLIGLALLGLLGLASNVTIS